MKLHVLAGDSLVGPFQQTEIEGEIIVCRECLIDGDLIAENFQDFWNVREKYLNRTYPQDENFYKEKVRAEFEKLLENADGSEVNLWFEYEAFCQVNLWFCLWLLSDKRAEIFIVYPFLEHKNDLWKGFANLDEIGLKKSYEKRIKLEKKDIFQGKSLWKSFYFKDFERFKYKDFENSEAFPTLNEVSQALAEIETRPKNAVRKILENGEKKFGTVFQAFNETEKIYGFGDLQVKKMYDQVIDSGIS